MNVVIAGGGTAGWLAALFIARGKYKHKVTVIESTQIGIIGAGEGSTGLLTDVLTNTLWPFGCNFDDFIKKTGAGLKYGILHKNWRGDSKEYFAPLSGSPTAQDLPDGAFHYQNSSPDGNHLITELGQYYSKNKLSFDIEANDLTQYTHALHFDAHKVGKYFKDLLIENNEVDHIDSKIEDVVLDSKGFIKKLTLENNKTISGDFFIDATGFAKVLSSKLQTKWYSYSKHLPVNSAMPFIVDYKEDETPKPYTTAHAHSAGWMWEIPTLERKGCGYVFDDNFITIDQAQQEIETTLGHQIDPIRILKFDTGRLEKLWTKNCLSIGLSAAFAEPLEATSIHSTIVQLNAFAFEFLQDRIETTCNETNIIQYNKRMTKMYDDFKDFLVLHYQGKRKDSKFWQWISTGETKTDFVNYIIDLCKSRSPNYNDFDQYWGTPGWPLWSWILGGLEIVDSNLSKKEIDYNIPNLGNYSDVLLTSRNQWLKNRNIDMMTRISYPEWCKLNQ